MQRDPGPHPKPAAARNGEQGSECERVISIVSPALNEAQALPAMCVRRRRFERLGHYSDVEILEGLIFGERWVALERPLERPTLVDAAVVTDSREFVQRGVFRGLLRCIVILLCFELRLPIPEHSFFRPVR